ncbi:hypothetical protein, partial [Pseudomonas fulva]|uniref:hypothetical protein n=1 Tax=Pseudomonas fulva TaxID=47880 RepID=UPI001E49725B
QKVTRRKGEKVIKRRHRKWTMLSINTHTNPVELQSSKFKVQSSKFKVQSSKRGRIRQVGIHWRGWRTVTLPPLRRLTFCLVKK